MAENDASEEAEGGDEEFFVSSRFAPLPPIFWSFEQDAPFSTCSDCGCSLLEGNAPYLVEKAFRRVEDAPDEVVFEYALCMECCQRHREAYSEESLERLEGYFHQHVDLEARSQSLLRQDDPTVEPWLARCLFKDTPRERSQEYQICGLCVEGDLLFQGLPFCLSGEALDEIIELLSPETLGYLGDLGEKLFGLGDLTRPRVPVLL
ncbi:MAG: hypothetical protein AAF555_07705 [Verrucomicrobiota bacterium]